MVQIPTTIEELQRRPRGRPPKFDKTKLEQEIAWRTWFPTTAADFSTDLTDAQAEELYLGCLAFMEDNLFIKVPGKGRIPLRLRDAQKLVLYDWIKYRRTVALKARQIGFSTLAAAYVLWLTFGYPDRLVVMLSKTERESIKLLAKVKYNLKGMPDWVRERGPKLLDRTKQVMTFDNDSSIESLPSANDPARGESVFLVVIDEWAFLPNPEEAWASVEPITDIGGRVLGISTAKGEGNFFHKLWLGSQSHENTFQGIFFPWSAVDSRDQEWYDQKKRNMEPWQIAQEYPSTPEEAFVGSGNPVFNLEILSKYSKLPPVASVTISATSKTSIDIYEGGPFQIWETPNDELRYTYAIGADVAEGLEHGDYTVAWVLCVNTGLPVAVWHGKVEPDVFGETILPAIGWYYRNAVIAPEVNNHGLTVLKALQRAGYSRIYRRRTFTKRQDRPLESLGWLTTHTSKPLAIDELGMFLRETSNIPHERTTTELRQFVRDPKGRMSGSPHDDCVMALAIAVQAKKYAITERLAAERPASQVPGTFAWFEKRLDASNRSESKRRHGRLLGV